MWYALILNPNRSQTINDFLPR